MERSEQELAFLMAHDSDPFNRWDAGQQLALQVLLSGTSAYQRQEPFAVPDFFHQAFARLLADEQSDPAFLAQALTLPSENWIGQQLSVIDPEAVFVTRQEMRSRLSLEHRDLLWELYYQLDTGEPYIYSAPEAGRRSLKNVILAYLLSKGITEPLDRELLAAGEKQYRTSDNMTDTLAALQGVVNGDRELGDRLLADFYDQCQHDPLVVDKWLTLQATCSLPGTLERVKALTGHPAFSLKNPNKVRALIGAFCSTNHHQFHADDGSGYLFLADQILLLDALNPQIAARLLTPLTLWRRYDARRQEHMLEQLRRIAGAATLSDDVGEIVARSLPGQ